MLVEDARTNWKGFKIVGDKIDKNIRRSFQRVDYTTQSFHYFHAYAILDRIDFSGLSDLQPTGEIDVNQLIPSDDDTKSLKKMLATLVTRFIIIRSLFKCVLFKCMHEYRILVLNMEEFSSEKKDVVWHIDHKYSVEMKQKSEVV